MCSCYEYHNNSSELLLNNWRTKIGSNLRIVPLFRRSGDYVNFEYQIEVTVADTAGACTDTAQTIIIKVSKAL